jgi:hypothetical protein
MADKEVAYGKTAVGQLLYDLAFVDRTDKWLARKHSVTIGEIRNLRKSPILDKLRKQVSRDLRRKLAGT